MGECPHVMEFYRGLRSVSRAEFHDILKRANYRTFWTFLGDLFITLNEVLIEHFSVSHGFAKRSHCKLIDGRKK